MKTSGVYHKNGTKDTRYSVSLEWTGKSERHHVARFCGEWIGSEETNIKAWLLCIYHDDERNYNML